MKNGADAVRKPVHAVMAKKNLFGKETMVELELDQVEPIAD